MARIGPCCSVVRSTWLVTWTCSDPVCTNINTGNEDKESVTHQARPAPYPTVDGLQQAGFLTNPGQQKFCCLLPMDCNASLHTIEYKRFYGLVAENANPHLRLRISGIHKTCEITHADTQRPVAKKQRLDLEGFEEWQYQTSFCGYTSFFHSAKHWFRACPVCGERLSKSKVGGTDSKQVPWGKDEKDFGKIVKSAWNCWKGGSKIMQLVVDVEKNDGIFDDMFCVIFRFSELCDWWVADGLNICMFFRWHIGSFILDRATWCYFVGMYVEWSGVECEHLRTAFVVISLSHIIVCSHNLSRSVFISAVVNGIDAGEGCGVSRGLWPMALRLERNKKFVAFRKQRLKRIVPSLCGHCVRCITHCIGCSFSKLNEIVCVCF